MPSQRSFVSTGPRRRRGPAVFVVAGLTAAQMIVGASPSPGVTKKKAASVAVVAAPLTVSGTWDQPQPPEMENDSLFFDLTCDDNARLYGRSLQRVTDAGFPGHLTAGDAPFTLPFEVLGSSTCSMRINARASTIALTVNGAPIAVNPTPQFRGLAVRIEDLKLNGPTTIALDLSRSTQPYRRDRPRPTDPGDREVALDVVLDYSFPAPGTWSISPTGCSGAYDPLGESTVAASIFASPRGGSLSGGAYVSDGATCSYSVNAPGVDRSAVRVFRNGQPVDTSTGSFTIAMDSDVSIVAFVEAIPPIPRKAPVTASATKAKSSGGTCLQVSRRGKVIKTKVVRC